MKTYDYVFLIRKRFDVKHLLIVFFNSVSMISSFMGAVVPVLLLSNCVNLNFMEAPFDCAVFLCFVAESSIFYACPYRNDAVRCININPLFGVSAKCLVCCHCAFSNCT